MDLIIDKFERFPDIAKLKSGPNDILEDVVFSYMFRFEDPQKTKKSDFIMFTFNYLLDKYENETTLSTDILVPNSGTGDSFFWNFGRTKKGGVKKDQIIVEDSNSTLVEVKRIRQIKDNTLSFNELYDIFVEDALLSHDNFLSHLKNQSIDYPGDKFAIFRNKLKDYIDLPNTIQNNMLDPVMESIEKYNITSLKNKLSSELQHNQINNKKMKI